MSASTEKKNRTAAREAGTDKRSKALAEEEKKRAKTKKRIIWASVFVVLFIAVIIILNSSLLFTSTTAVKMDDEAYTPADVQYLYASEYYTFYSNYGSYAPLFGLDTTYGLSGLGSQECGMLEDGGTWRDYFRNTAVEELRQITALNEYAEANGIALDEEETAEINDTMAELDETATSYGYANANKFLSGNYGKGVTKDVVKEYSEMSTLASKAYDAYSEGLDITEDEIQEEYNNAEGGYDLFNYAYYYVAAEQETTVDENGEETTDVTEETLAAAKATADAIAEAFESGDDKTTEGLTAAVNAVVEGDSASDGADVLGSNLSTAYSEWLMDSSRKEGDVTVVETSTANAYYVVMFISRDSENYDAAEDTLRSNATSEWLTEITDAVTVTNGFGYRFVGKAN